jgi:hypothetical protein
MSSFPVSLARLMGGIELIDFDGTQVVRIIVLQHNPDRLTRSCPLESGRVIARALHWRLGP